jgi:catechol 2,3-dioxygenase-like lactoylglutathione lyase family enzyme
MIMNGRGGPAGEAEPSAVVPGGTQIPPTGLPVRDFLPIIAGMTITQIQLFSLPVTDQDRARDFYVGTLGFELVADTAMGPGQRWVQVRPPGAATSITLVTWFPTMPAGSAKGTVLETGDLDGDVAALRARGVVIDAGVQEAPWGRFVTFDDPDGNGLILQATAAAPPPGG